MRNSGAGQRWGHIDKKKIQEHDLERIRTEAASLEQTFQRPGERPFSIRLTFLSTRPRLARVLANTFWIVHQEGQRRATLTACAHTLRLLCRFLDYRKKSQADVRSARQLHQDVLKEMAVWLLVKRRLKRRTAAHAVSMCCWFLRSGIFNPDQCISGHRKRTVNVQGAITGHISEDSDGSYKGDRGHPPSL